MLLKLGEILEGIDLIQLTGVDQTHEQVTHASSILCLVEVGVLTMKFRFLGGHLIEVLLE